MGVFYGIADTINIHNNYQGGQWNVLTEQEGNSTVMWGNLTKDTDLRYQKTLISDDQAEILNFIRGHIEVWASDPNQYQNTLGQIQMLRSDFSIRNRADYNDKAWNAVIQEYYRAMSRHHGG